MQFHHPGDGATDAMVRFAKPTEPHDPHQPQRKIPDIGVTISAQRRFVELAIDRISPPQSTTREPTSGA